MYSSEESEIILQGFNRLKDVCYLDNSSAALYSEAQVWSVMQDLCQNIYGNPHSLSVTSRVSTDAVDQVRYRILQHFNSSSENYSVIFTSGATAALKLVAESFDWENTAADQKAENKKNILKHDSLKNAGTFVYLQDNHTSVLGMRELAYDKCSEVKCLSQGEAFSLFNSTEECSTETSRASYTGNSLFVYPAQCNFSGVKYPLSWIEKTHNGALNKCITLNKNSKWHCLLDAASYVSTNVLDLSVVKPDFVSVSFYKIFGYPTGIGALLVRNDSVPLLKRKYFGGGTVLISLSSERFHVPRPDIADRFEDGTLPFLSIIAVRHGFDTIASLPGGMEKISSHTFALAQSLFQTLLTLHHHNGNPAAVLYCDTDYQDCHTQGGVVNFNLLRPDGEYIGFVQVLNMANLYGIQLRTGCFCNPGACQRHLKLSTQDLLNHFQAGHICGDEHDIINGQPTGSVRVSFGYTSTQNDVQKLVDMICKCFIEGPPVFRVPDWWTSHVETYRKIFFVDVVAQVSENEKKDYANINSSVDVLNVNNIKSNKHFGNRSTPLSPVILNVSSNVCDTKKFRDNMKLTHIFLYPIKSCGAFPVESWSLGQCGLLFDREWMIVTAAGTALTQKQDTKLCLIKPVIDLKNNQLHLTYPGMPSVSISLMPDVSHTKTTKSSLCQSKVCGDRILGWDCGDTVAEWLSDALCRDGLRLVRQQTNEHRIKTDKETMKMSQLSLSNQAQYLLINKSSIHWLQEKLDVVANTLFKEEDLLRRFRSNLVVHSQEPFEEKNWRNIQIGNIKLQFDGPCTRCQMICIDQSTGEKTVEPLKTLAASFHGKMRFGVYFSHEATNDEAHTISVGDEVVVLSRQCEN